MLNPAPVNRLLARIIAISNELRSIILQPIQTILFSPPAFLGIYNILKMQREAILQSTGEQDNARIFKIELTNKSIRAITALKEYEKLRYLNLSYNLIERIDNLHVLPDLRELHLENNCLIKISSLEANKNMQVLNLADNKIQKIENIGHILKLETLTLDSNCITKLTGVEYLKELKSLSLRKNQIESVEVLPTFSKLCNLLLSHNRIRVLSPSLFMSSKALQVLDLSHNRLQSTVFLQHLSALEVLDLRHNCLHTFQAPQMPNLESLNLSQNEIDKLPSIAVCFPELIALDLSHNLLCSEMELLTSVSEVVYLTQLDFRDNPMHSQNFESALQRIHQFDFLNGKAMSKAGAKYYQQVAEIQKDLANNRQFYGADDQKDREIRMSGFFDEELEFQMTGLRSTRPSSPKKKRVLQKASFYDDLDRSYHQFVANDSRIKAIREQYLKICGQYNIVGQHITEVPITETEPDAPLKEKEERKFSVSQQLQATESQLKKENEKNLNKWKELKNRERTFKIRDVIKSRGRDASANTRVPSTTTNSNWNHSSSTATGPKGEQLFKTQLLPRKNGEELLRTIGRPNSQRKRE